jgi:hypothetical protein
MSVTIGILSFSPHMACYTWKRDFSFLILLPILFFFFLSKWIGTSNNRLVHADPVMNHSQTWKRQVVKLLSSMIVDWYRCQWALHKVWRLHPPLLIRGKCFFWHLLFLSLWTKQLVWFLIMANWRFLNYIYRRNICTLTLIHEFWINMSGHLIYIFFSILRKWVAVRQN